MVRLSVNVNKIATLRNARGGNIPDVVEAARTCIAAGCHGITVHPRPDARHITFQDVFDLAAMMKLAPSTQYLFGTDYPAEPMESTVDHLPENDLPADIQRAMYRENAERLYPRLKSL